MSIIQISKIQIRSGNLVDLPQLDDAELGWASDDKKLFIGKTDPNENVEILTSYSTINFDAINGSYGNLDIDPFTAANGQALIFNGVDWVNRGGDVGGLIDLGDVSNVKISGGSIGYVLETDGTGNLSWGPKGTVVGFIENVEKGALLPTYSTAVTQTFANNFILVGNVLGYTANAPITFTGISFEPNIVIGNLYYANTVDSTNSLITIKESISGSDVVLSAANGNMVLNMIGTILTTVSTNFFTEGAEVTITDAIGMTELNGNSFYVDLISSNTIGLFLNPGLTTPLYSNNYSNYAFTNLVYANTPNVITVGNTAQFSNNAPIRFVGDLLDSGLALNTTYYIKNIESSTQLTVSASINNGIAGNAYPVNNETFVDASMYAEGGRVIGSISSSTGTDAAGANTTIQYNAQNQLGGSANLRFNYNSSPVELILVGTANMSNVLVSTLLRAPQFTSNIATGTAPLVVSSTTVVNNLNADLLDGYDTETTATANTVAVRDINASLSANFFIGNFTGTLSNGNSSISIPAANGNVNISAVGNANVLVVTGTGVNVTGTLNATGNANTGNLGTNTAIITTGNIATINSGLMQNGNSSISIPAANGNINLTAGGGTTELVVTTTGVNVAGTLNATGNANTGNLGTAQVLATANVTSPQLISNVATGTAPLIITSNTKVSNLNADLLDGYDTATAATANTVAVRNTNGNLTANFFIGNGSQLTGLITSSISNGNSNVSIPAANGNVNISAIGNANVLVVTGTGFIVNGDGNITGNLTVSNVAIITTGNIGTLNTSKIQNGNSNIAIPSPNGNITLSVTGVANLATFANNRLIIAGNIETSTGYISANGNITANGNISGGNLSITTNTTTGSLTTATITAPTGNLTISAAGTNQSIFLQPSGTGTVDIAGKRLTQVGSVVSPSDATNKEYVDAIAGTGLTIHNPANVALTTNLIGAYAVGGTTQTTTTISNGNTITFSASHSLSVNDGIVWTNTFNGIVGGEAYWVESVVSATQITIKDGYFGSQVTTLTNGTGLSQASRANPGVGATLTNSGANVALTIDGVAVNSAQRVLLLGQTTGEENGVYVVTNAGSGAVAWVLTRSTDMNKYIPGSSSGMGSGDYLFVTQGTTNAGTSWVLSSPTDEIIIGTDSVSFSQFSAAGSYSAGNGISISGTIISANVDNTTTGFVGGNIVVIANAAFTTPNIGAATGTSLTVTGNVSANNISVSNLANVTGNITTNANVLANINVVANGNVSGGNVLSSGIISATGNILGGNLTTTGYFFRSVETGISANGTNQTQATGITKEINVVSTVNSGTGVRLPTAVAGMVLIITNTSANNLLVYPNTSGIINSLAANAGYTMPASATLQFVAPTTTQWYTVGASYA